MKFTIPDDKNFNDLKVVFDLIKEANSFGQPRSDGFWLQNFPDYTLKNFYFLDSDEKPKFKTAPNDSHTWHFYSLIALLQTDYAITYDDCFKISDAKGQLNYNPYSYPYGGISGLIVFVLSFGCVPTVIDDGTGIYEISFLANGDFVITDLEHPKKPE